MLLLDNNLVPSATFHQGYGVIRLLQAGLCGHPGNVINIAQFVCVIA